MKFQPGQIIVVNNILEAKDYPGVFNLNKSFVQTRIRRHLAKRLENVNPIGIISWCAMYNDAWEQNKGDGPRHNVYTWLSQRDGIHYWFCEQDIVDYSLL